MADLRDSGGYLMALLAGAAFGFVVGVLVAPASGQETRRRLARRLEDEKEDLVRKGRRLAEDAVEQLEEGKRKLAKAVKA